MPFRCKCGRTFEKTDSFGSHTSACPQFHSRRSSDTSPGAYQKQPQDSTTEPSQVQRTSFPFIDSKILQSLASNFLSPTLPESADSFGTGSLNAKQDHTIEKGQQETAMPQFMPTSLYINNAFEGVRGRSASYNSSWKE
ncbi:hypothetical protein J3Q64DRAFT_1831720 [Phycomyces blakesleeanus]|uniref:Uncharacterized protein n=2 Tax=Phycomyces blakesleeanus TaxID=4837 RepID=A0A163A0E7_PHYB8|nr:hypothetical protein PHYBLDRAFT_148759 [Phycomyces blakesleeanus NRRL 1555(-)]OAD70211.1 hypothetical protein PHYBLDRAFT_148759 [Phycomyces blakesleeanus NRRL 1555(-)]|eukprot:XP_018288251.1 hypothetical protein PHYBLDRAFT_148759 [Phycomyces blakesleeanus NRRL 1555(-)]